MLRIELDQAAGPAYQQIVDQVKAARAHGELRPGERLPTVRALAAQLGLNRNTVAHAYQLLREQGLAVGQAGGGTCVAEEGGAGLAAAERLRGLLEPAVRDALAIGMAPPEIDALVRQAVQRWQPPAPDSGRAGRGESLVRFLGSHDFCLDVLARRMREVDPHTRLSWAPVGSTAGLLALGRGTADLAGVHLLDPATGDYNRPAVSRLLPAVEVQLVTLVHREQGLLVRRGNPLGLREAADLARPDVRVAMRQAGSGTSVLLEHLLARYGLTLAQVRRLDRELATHLAVAAAVASGAADVGLGVRAAARALDLEFVPLAVERYDLAFRCADQGAPWLAALLEALASPALRFDIEALEGYDASRTAWFQ